MCFHTRQDYCPSVINQKDFQEETNLDSATPTKEEGEKGDKFTQQTCWHTMAE